MNKLLIRLTAIAGGLLLLGAQLCMLPASADDDNTFTDNMLTYERISGGVRIIHADSSLTKINIPKSIATYPIIEIGEKAFAECTGLAEVNIKAELRSIGATAFSGCFQLAKVQLPDTLETIGDGAFAYCAALESLEIPASVKSIGSYAFAYCMKLKSVNIPEGITELNSYLFYYDDALETVTLPDSLEEIAPLTFVSCSSLKSLEIPAKVHSIGQMFALSCSGIQEITAAAGNETYKTADNVLYDADGKTLLLYSAGSDRTEFAVPDGTASIAPYAFSGSVNLETVTFPASLTDIGDGAFADCYALKNVTYPQLDRIGSSVFADCPKLESFTIPETVTALGDYAFFGCTALKEITIPAAVTAIGNETFCGCIAMKEMTVPETVLSIGDYAIGYKLLEDGSGDPVLSDDFLLHVTPQSAAKAYASENKLKYKQHGIDTRVIMWVLFGLAGVLLIVGAVMYLRGKKQEDAEQAAANPAPEEPADPNYRSILDDDAEGDPYDRSYGFRADDTAETTDETDGQDA